MYGTVVVVMILQVCWNFKMVDDPKQYCGWSKIKVVMITASHMIHCDFNAMSTWGVRGARFSWIKRPERSWPLPRNLLSLNSKFSFFMSKNNFTSRCPSPRLLSAYGDIVTRLQQRWTFPKNTVTHIFFVFITILTRVSNQGDDPKKTFSFPYFCFCYFFHVCKQDGHSIISQYFDNNSSQQVPMMNISKQKFTAVLGLLPVLLDRLHLVELGQSHLPHLAVHQGCPTNLPETFHPGSFVLYFWPFLFSPIHRVLFSNIPAYFQ